MAGQEQHDHVTVEIPAAARKTPVCEVAADEVWTFRATGRWRDWWISCGPEGYRNFPAEILGLYPRKRNAPFFALIGEVRNEDGGESFVIGRGGIHRFQTSGTLFAYANDLPSLYGNNYDSVGLEAVRGGLFLAHRDDDQRYAGPFGTWALVKRTLADTRGIITLVLLLLAVGMALSVLPQGRDLLRAASSDGEGWHLLPFTLSLLLLAFQSWLWPRMIIESNYGSDRHKWHPHGLLVLGPRVIGFIPILAVFLGLVTTPSLNVVPILGVVISGIVFLWFTIRRYDSHGRLRWRKRFPNADFQRLSYVWARVSLAASLVLILATASWPVSFGWLLGAPAVVFLGVALIIPVIATIAQMGSGLRLPVVLILAIWAVGLSLVLDNHHVGHRAGWLLPLFAGVAVILLLLARVIPALRGRWLAVGLAAWALACFAADNRWLGQLPVALGVVPAERFPISPSARLSLEQAYKLWRAAQPPAPAVPLMVLVAAEGGASRAGDWTAEVLSQLHEQWARDNLPGSFASHVFAINSVSGGSVGAVGYIAMLHGPPPQGPAGLRARLTRFTGSDVLSPVVTGLLYTDLFYRVLPLPGLPDRAEGLERGWEKAWKESYDCTGTGCISSLAQPFLSLTPDPKHWTPIPIVQGASQENGRRILTSPLRLDPKVEVDADDFLDGTNGDVAISTAIHNGARFPYVSPAGTLDRGLGHIVDGGYFDASGTETIRELARAIRVIAQKNGDTGLKIVMISIGYDELPPPAHPSGWDAVSQWFAAWLRAHTPANDIIAPLSGFWNSRDAHATHMLCEAQRPTSDTSDRVIRVAMQPKPEFAPPMDWALSQAARDFIAQAAGAQIEWTIARISELGALHPSSTTPPSRSANGSGGSASSASRSSINATINACDVP